MASYLLSCITSSFSKVVNPKRKEFAPRGSKFFSFRVDPFSAPEGSGYGDIVSLRQICNSIGSRSDTMLLFIYMCFTMSTNIISRHRMT